MPYAFNHFGITVADIDRSAKFYGQFGFEMVEPAPVDVDTAWIKEMSGMPDAHLKIVHLKLGDVVLELLQYVSPRGENMAGMPTSNPGSAHVAIGVYDLFAEYKRLSAAGMKFRSKQPIVIPDHLPFGGTKAVYGTDPDGYTFELLEWRG